MTLPTETLLLAGIGLILLAMLGIATWLSARMRATAREIQRAFATSRRLPVAAPAVPAAPRQQGPFWEKQQEVYAGLYARYRRACDRTISRPDRTPDFSRFSRDELLRYLSRRNVRERDATDAIAALDRGDMFAMTRLMTRLHERVDQRDASIALQRATHFEQLHELYLSDPVRDAVAAVRQRLTPRESAGQPLGERRMPAATSTRAPEREVLESLAALQRLMRDELSGAVADGSATRPARLAVPGEQPISREVHVDGVRAS